ncbi:MAG TPA: hypothetical protein ENK81_00800 [Euryarchaeota archaeon]|nr:hypothetical protein [Euryarchaeota archaeon]
MSYKEELVKMIQCGQDVTISNGKYSVKININYLAWELRKAMDESTHRSNENMTLEEFNRDIPL